jgi:mono/diheme cytochrome c family protein
VLPSLAQNKTAAPARQQSVVERGKYLAQAGDCIACHTVPGAKIFSGNRPMPTPFGTLYAPNITPTARPASASGAPATSTT